MLQISYLRENKEEAIKRLAIKNVDAASAIENILQLDEQRRKTQTELDKLLADSNQWAKEIGKLFKEGKQQEADELKQKSTAAKDQVKKLEELQPGNLRP